MNKWSWAGIAATAFLLSGCIPSINPIYTEKDLVYEPMLVGEWTGEDASDNWKFSKKGEKEYEFVYTDGEGKKGSFSAHLAKIDDQLYLDLYPDPAQPAMQGNDFYKSLFVPSHTFLRVPKLDEELELSALNMEWLGEYLLKHPDAVAYAKVGDGVVFTAKTADLQSFVKKLKDQKEAWGEPKKLMKKKATP